MAWTYSKLHLVQLTQDYYFVYYNLFLALRTKTNSDVGSVLLLAPSNDSNVANRIVVDIDEVANVRSVGHTASTSK